MQHLGIRTPPGDDMSTALTEDVQLLCSGLAGDQPEIEVTLRLPRESAKKVLALLDAEQSVGAVVIPGKQEFTTTEAAKILDMSRPTLMNSSTPDVSRTARSASTTASQRRRFRPSAICSMKITWRWSPRSPPGTGTSIEPVGHARRRAHLGLSDSPRLLLVRREVGRAPDSLESDDPRRNLAQPRRQVRPHGRGR